MLSILKLALVARCFLPSGHLAPLSVQSQRIPFGHKMYTLLETSTKLGTIVNFNLVGGLHGGIIS